MSLPSPTTTRKCGPWQQLSAIDALIASDLRLGLANLVEFIITHNRDQEEKARKEFPKYRLVMPQGDILPSAILNDKGERYAIIASAGPEPWVFGRLDADPTSVENPSRWFHERVNTLAAHYGLPLRLISKHQRIVELRLSEFYKERGK